MTTTYPFAYSPRYTPDGATTTFSTAFNFRNAAEVQVVAVDAADNFTIVTTGFSLINGQTAPQCVFDVAPSVTSTMATFFFLLVPSALQSLHLVDEGAFLPSDIESAFDESAMRDANLAMQVAASLRVQPGDILNPLPTAPLRAGKALAFDPITGQPIVTSLAFSVTNPSGVLMFGSLLAASAAMIPASPYIATSGYYSPGDGGGALYVAATAGAGNGKFMSADGQWWAYVIPPSGVEVRALGATGNNVSDDTAALAAADTLATNSGVSLRFAPGQYLLGTSRAFTSHVVFPFGSTIHVPNGVTATFNKSVTAGLWLIFNHTGSGAIVLAPQYNPIGLPEWFGSKGGDNTVDSIGGLRLCVATCPVTLLQPTTYYISAPLALTSSNSALVGPTAPGVSGATANLCIQSATAHCLKIGAAADPGSVAAMPFNITVDRVGFFRDRAVTPPTVGNEANGPSGIFLRYVNGCRITDCLSGDPNGHSISYNISVCADVRLIRCASYRGSVGTTGANDIYWCIALFGSAPYYLQNVMVDDCQGSIGYAFAGTGNLLGIGASGVAADCKIINNRFPGMQYGCLINGAGEALANTDVEISGNRFDQCSIYGIFYENATAKSAARIVDNFVRMQTGGIAAQAAISIQANGGFVTSAANECYGNGSTAIGLQLIGASGVFISRFADKGSIFTDFQYPVQMTGAFTCSIESVIKQTSQVVSGAAVDILGASSRHKIAPLIQGDANGLVPIGVRLSATTTFTEVNMSGIDPACLPGGASATKLYLTGTGNIIAAGVFNANCLATGIAA